jgi:nucleotide-binding universal stress UspA family protein
MKVLIAVDGSPGGFEAVRQTGQLLEASKDQVAFYYSPPGIKVQSGSTSPEVLAKAQVLLADAIFDEARQLLPSELRTSAEKILGKEPPKHGVLDAAATYGAQMIALGARGLGPIERLLLGSVSAAVVNASQVPVLVVRPRPTGQENAPFRVLVACESAAADGHLADRLNTFHWPADTEGYTIAVVQSMFAGHVPQWLEERARSEEVEQMARAWVTEHEAEIRSKEQELQDFDRRLPAPFAATKPFVVEGHPAEKILEVIKERNINLAVLGARTPASVTRFLLGSTSRTVLNQAACSVLVVPVPKC